MGYFRFPKDASNGTDQFWFYPENQDTTFVYPELSEIIINSPFETDINSVVGPTPSFSRNLARNYANSRTTLATVSSGTPVIGATVFGATDSLASGLEIVGETENLLLYSEDFSNAAWTSISGGSVTPSATLDPFGGTNAFTLSGTGIECDSGYAAQNAGFPQPTVAFLFSFFAKVTSGTALGRIGIGPSGSSSFDTSLPCRLTTEWQRFEIWSQMWTALAGNAVCRLFADGTPIVIFGAQLQRAGNTGGSNMRARAGAGPYVATNGSTKYCNTEIVTYPSATVDLARSQGTISFWVKPSRDGTMINEGNIISYFSLASEQFSLYDSGCAATLWIGNAARYKVLGMGFRTGVWNHVCVTWNESTGHQLILVNGQTYVDNSSAFTTWPAGNDLYLGQHSGTPQYWSAFAVFRNFVMWKKEITKAEALSIYNGQKSIFAESYDTGLLFDLDLGDSIAPSTAKNYPVIYDGTLVPTSYAIANPSAYIPYYSDGSTYVGNAPWDTPARPAAPPLNTATNRGMVFEGTMKNYIAAPFSLTAVWALIGTPTRTNNVGDMFGPNFKYGTLVGTAGQGMRRDTGGAAADTSWVFSFWVSVASGTLNGEITLTTATAAETTTVPFTATTTPQQVFVYKQFTGAATGNVRSQFTLTDSGTLRIGGFQLEKRNASQTYNIQAPAVLVPTNFDRLPNYLWYKTAGNINPKVGTAIVWAWLDCDSAKIENSDGPNFISICGDQGQWVLDLHYVSDNLNFSFGGDLSKVATYPMPGVLANVWYQYGISWNMNDVGVGTIKLYLDGAVVATQSITDGILPGWSRLLLGAGMMAQLATDHHKGGIGQFRSWGTQDDSLVLSDWNANRADYGR